ncbi:MAG: hypothetical protein RR278_03630 [Mucinivorans sp.]
MIINKSLLLALVLVAGLAGCTKSDRQSDTSGPYTISAAISGEGASRTELKNADVLWNTGDKILVVNQNAQATQAEYTLATGAGTTGATFESRTNLIPGPRYAFYPSGKDVNFTNNSLAFILPATQTYKRGSFAVGSNPMVGQSDGSGVLQFKNLCGVIKISITGTQAVSSIVLESSPTEYLSGPMTLSLIPGAPLHAVGGDLNKVTLDNINVTLSPDKATDFYFVVPARTYSAGLRVVVYESPNNMLTTKATTKDLVVYRSTVAALQTLSALSFSVTVTGPDNWIEDNIQNL